MLPTGAAQLPPPRFEAVSKTRCIFPRFPVSDNTDAGGKVAAMQTNPDKLLTLQDVADYCDVPEMVVYRWINRKQLTVCFLENGEHRFRLIDVRAAHEAHKKRPRHSTTLNLPRLKNKKIE
jgi:hypothetical protein